MCRLTIMKRIVGAVVIGLGLVAGASQASGWNYAEGTERWGHITAEYAACSDGLAQSPIDVIRANADRRDLPAMNFAYATSASMDVVNKGHTIQTEPVATGNALIIGRKRYELVQFHVHTPSENFLDGEQYPLEMHFVHRAADGSLAVVGVFYDQGPADPQLQKIVSAIPAEEGGRKRIGGLDLRNLIPAGRTYRFTGSLTTPPCSEGIAWHVMSQVRTASYAQLAAFDSLFSGHEFPGGNRRPVQSLNGRVVKTED
jgi:carbonic anhydrase